MSVTYADFTPQRRAAYAVSKAIKAGEMMRPANCERCGCTGKRIEAHHDDYDKPLDVEWICCSCHRREHARTGSRLDLPPNKPAVLWIPRKVRARPKRTNPDSSE